MTVPAAALPNYESYERGKHQATYDELGSTVANRGASMIAVADAGNNFPAITGGVEGCLAALALAAYPLSGPANAIAVPVVTTAVKAANKWAVSIQVNDLAGAPVAAAKKVKVTTLAVTADKGDITATGGGAGSVDIAQNPATGDNVAMCTTDATGLLNIDVTDSAAENCGIWVEVEGGLSDFLLLTS